MTLLESTDAAAFVAWMLDGVVAEGRGDHMQTLPVAPKGRLWLGRLAPEVVVQNSRLGERSERLEPCEAGVRLRLSEVDGRTVRCTGRLVVWCEFDGGDEPEAPKWRKSEPIEVTADLETPRAVGPTTSAGRDDFASALSAVGADGMVCEFHAELEMGKDGLELVVTLVNLSPEEIPHWDTNVYEASLVVDAGETLSFTLDNLPDSFRYDRTVAAYGVNGGVEQLDHATFRTTDVAVYDQPRPTYWDDEIGDRPDISFATLASDPLPALHDLVDACERWGADHWAAEVLAPRADAEGWDDGMRAEADDEAAKFFEELARLRSGLSLLETNRDLLRSFTLANRAFAESPLVRHTDWRAFQLGFLLANVGSIVDDSRDGERRIVDTLWFATGGGKTETYLLYVLTAAFYDRLRGKREGITSWGRFPLRMLSLQQTQRFADVLAAAELVRRDEHIGGREFSLGFFVGKQGTPNKIKRKPDFDAPDDPADADMPGRYQVLLRCPFCGSDGLQMRFDQTRWTLDHVCAAPRLPVGRTAPAVSHRRRRDLSLAAHGRARHTRQGGEHRGAGGDARFLRRPLGPMLGTGSRVHLRAPERFALAAASSPVATRPRIGSARTAACTRRLSECRTSSTCCETAWAPSTRTTRRSSMRSRPTTVRCPRSLRHRPPSPGTPNRSPLCIAGLAARSRVPARKPAAPSGRATPTCSPAASQASRHAG